MSLRFYPKSDEQVAWENNTLVGASGEKLFLSFILSCIDKDIASGVYSGPVTLHPMYPEIVIVDSYGDEGDTGSGGCVE